MSTKSLSCKNLSNFFVIKLDMRNMNSKLRKPDWKTHCVAFTFFIIADVSVIAVNLASKTNCIHFGHSMVQANFKEKVYVNSIINLRGGYQVCFLINT